MKKLGVLFPGMGYHVDKPLLYYAGRLLKQEGYEVAAVDYGKVPHEKEKALKLARAAAFLQVADLALEEYEDIVFAGKSIGTAIAGEISRELKKRVKVRNLFYTPIPETCPYFTEEGIVFSGTNDPYMDAEELKKACEKYNKTLYRYENANHSLETENILEGIENIKDVMEKSQSFLRKK